MANAGSLLKLVPQNLEISLSEVEKKLIRINDEILAPILQDKNLVDGGSIWKGKGAEGFSNEIAGKVEPDFTQLMQSMRDFIGLIEEASTAVQTTDQTLANQVTGTLDVEFAQIYN